MKAIDDKSYGIIPLKLLAGEWHVLLVQHTSAGYWGFPKGHANEGEMPQNAAMRELFEETHLEVVRFFSKLALAEFYQFYAGGNLVKKTVFFFVAEVSGEVQLQMEEVKDSCWVNLDSALQVITHETDKSIFRKATTLIH